MSDYTEQEDKAKEILNTQPPYKTRGFEIVNDNFRKHPEHGVILPLRGTAKSAGYDFYSNENATIQPGEKHLFWTDIKAYMLQREVLEIYVRSSIAIKKDLNLCNQVGIIDCVPKGTKIKIKSGEINVEELMNKPEVIISYNIETEENEEDKLKEIWIVNDLELLEIETVDGDSIKIPINKEVYTKRGWVKAKNLTYNDEILTF